jgi:hypothetical protein
MCLRVHADVFARACVFIFVLKGDIGVVHPFTRKKLN